MDPNTVVYMIMAALVVVIFAALVIGSWQANRQAPPSPTPQPAPQPRPQPTRAAPAQPTPSVPTIQPTQWARSGPESSGATNQNVSTATVIDKAKKEQSDRRRLQDLTWSEIRVIGADYGIKITGKVGTTWDRALLFVLGNLGLWGVCAALVSFLMVIVGFDDNFDFAIYTTALWLLVIGSTYRLWLVIVPKLTGLITTNLLNDGEMHTYGPGIGIKYPWERYTQDDYIDIQADVVEKTSKFVSTEGISVNFDWSMQFTPYLPMLPLYIRTASKAIAEGLTEVVESTFSISILGMGIDEMTHPSTIDLIRDNLLRMLEGRKVKDKDGNEVEQIRITDALGYPMEERFGLDVELGTLSAPDFDKDFKELKMGRVKARGMADDAKELATKTGVSSERALRTLMIMNKEKGVTDEAFTIDLSDNAKQAAGDAAEVLRAGVTVARATGRRPAAK